MNQTVSELVESVQVRAFGADSFEAIPPDPQEHDRVFGGTILAYVASAALQTADLSGLSLHSLHAHFLRPLKGGVRVELEVERWRDGRSFSTRQVTVVQNGERAASGTASFHIDEVGDEYQLKMDPTVQPPTLEPLESLPDNEWHRPFDVREAGPLLNEDGTFRSTRRAWFRLPGPLPDDPDLHTTLAVYLSDMTGSSFRPLSLERWGTHTDASIDHAIWIHRPVRVDEWLFYDLQAVVNIGARGLVRGCLFDSEGQLCLSIAQELLIRPLP